MTPPPSPIECQTMRDVRAGVDEVDRELVALLAKRFAYMDAAARIKPDRAAVRDELRKAGVLANVAAEARGRKVDGALMARLYEDIVDTSIALELVVYDRLRSTVE